ncbi:spermidine synthase [Miniimonas sp. S16]|uniref:spermidine synthase n=1 Tax=Miniimonas sp. S16 TaxID=2171623 RepID=UPI000D525A8C|nr:fused MFS/spermidine synthase [Miniimonas sp. S16]
MARRRSLPGDLPDGVVLIDTGTVELEPDPDRPTAVMVYVNGVESSYIDLADPGHLEFEYMQQMRLAMADLLEPSSTARVLHLGGAACAFARAIHHQAPHTSQLVVELDGELARLSRDWFDLPRAPRLRIRTAEARAAVASLQPDSWDAVVRDAFAGARVPSHLTTVEFLEQLAAILRPGGRYLGNLVDSPPLPIARREVATAREVFAHVALAVEPPILKARRFGNLVVIAGDTPPDAGLARELLGLPAPVRLVTGRELDDFVGTSAPLRDVEVAPGWATENAG